jgi:hypothetical protein
MAPDCPRIEVHDGLPLEQRECFSLLLELTLAFDERAQPVCLIGGWAVYALTEVFMAQRGSWPLRHRGSLDIDLAIGSASVTADEAEAMAATLRGLGYEGPESFRWHRQLSAPLPYYLDLMVLPPPDHPRGPVTVGLYEFAPFWNGEAAFADQRRIEVAGQLPNGTPARATLNIAGPAGLLVAKARAVVGLGRDQQAKHLYDVFALLRAYSDRPEDFARELGPLRGSEGLEIALDVLQVMFAEDDGGARLVAAMRAPEGSGDDVLATEAQLTVRRFLRAARERGV